MLGPIEPHTSLSLLAAPIALTHRVVRDGTDEALWSPTVTRFAHLALRAIATSTVLAVVGLTAFVVLTSGSIADPYPF
jgi:hypothetical protein